GGLFQRYDPPPEPVDDSQTRKLEEKLRLLEFNLLKHLAIQRAEVTQAQNQANFDLHLVFDPGSHDWHGLVVRVCPFNSEGIEPRELPPGCSTYLIFQNINESNLSQFLRFEIWQGSEQLRTFLMKIKIG